MWSTGLLAAIPFFLLLIVLAFDPRLRHLEVSDDLAGMDPPPTPMLPPDRSVLPTGRSRASAWPSRSPPWRRSLTWVPAVGVSLTGGLALALVFMSITLITGAAGQISLCQATFAGVGAFTAGQLATNAACPS